MASLSIIQPEGWSPPRGYSNGVLAPAGRRLLAVAGQIGWDASCRIVQPVRSPSPEGGEGELEDAFVTQFRQALHNVAAIVRSAGGDVGDVMSLRLYVTDKRRYLSQGRAIGAAYREIFGRHYPAMAAVQISALIEDEALVEIEALAAIP
jgi:enamine deaminase RidA (YjgF/YER057c/UK114 family)